MGRGPFVTCQEAKRMAELHEQGYGAPRIGEILGRPKSTVRYVAKRRREAALQGQRPR